MIDSFLTVAQQVLMLFMLVAIGFILGKLKLLSTQGALSMSNLMLYVVTPCAILSSFQRPLEAEHLHNFLLILAVSAILHVALVVLAQVTLRGSSITQRNTQRLTVVLANCGFMAFPLQSALFGPIGIFYGSAYVVIFTIATWTYGVYMASEGDKSKLKLRTLLLNPALLCTVVALVLYLTQISLPEIILTPVNYMAGLNTPVPMVIIGYHLSQANLKAALQSKDTLVAALLRLVVSPLLAIGLCLLFGMNAAVSTVLVIAAATPAAAVATMLISKFGKDAPLSSSLVSVQTLCSAVTLPVMVALTQLLIK